MVVFRSVRDGFRGFRGVWPLSKLKFCTCWTLWIHPKLWGCGGGRPLVGLMGCSLFSTGWQKSCGGSRTIFYTTALESWRAGELPFWVRDVSFHLAALSGGRSGGPCGWPEGWKYCRAVVWMAGWLISWLAGWRARRGSGIELSPCRQRTRHPATQPPHRTAPHRTAPHSEGKRANGQTASAPASEQASKQVNKQTRIKQAKQN